MNSVNLIPASRRERTAIRRRVRVWSGLLAGQCLLFGGVCAVGAGLRSGATPALVDELRAVERDITDRESEQRLVTTDLTRAGLALARAKAVSDRADWAVLLRLVATCRGDSIVLASTVLDPILQDARRGVKSKGGPRVAGYKLTITGQAQSQQAVGAFVLALEDTRVFSDVTLKDTRLANGNGGLAFMVEGLLLPESAKEGR